WLCAKAPLEAKPRTMAMAMRRAACLMVAVSVCGLHRRARFMPIRTAAMGTASPNEPQSSPELMIVGTAAHFTVVTTDQRSAVIEGRGGRDANDGAVALRRGAEHGELRSGSRGKARGDRPGGVGELVHPAQSQAEIDWLAAAEIEARREIGAEGRAHRCGRL